MVTFLPFTSSTFGRHGLTVLGAQLEDVAYFNAAFDLQESLPIGAGVAFSHCSAILYLGSGQSRSQFTPVRWIHPDLRRKIKSARCAALRSAITGIFSATGPSEPKPAPSTLRRRLHRPFARGDASSFSALMAIELVVAAHHQSASVRPPGAAHDQGLYECWPVYAEQGASHQCLYPGGGDSVMARCGSGARASGASRLSHFHIGGVIAAVS